MLTPEQAWVKAQFREGRNKAGELTADTFEQRLRAVADMPLVNLNNGQQNSVKDLYDL